MKVLLTIFIFMVFTITVFSQGVFLDRDQSGFGIGVGFATNKDVTGFEGSVSYSVSGIFDFGISVDRFGFDEKFLGKDLSAIVIAPSVSFYAFKQNEDIPISLAIAADYEWQNYSNEALDNYNIDMSGRYFSIGTSLFVYFKPSIYMKIQPSLGVTYVTGEGIVEDHNGNKQTEDSNATIFDIGLSLAFDTSPDNIFVIKPHVSINKGTTSFGLGLALIFTTN